jgi:hypothetical protein
MMYVPYSFKLTTIMLTLDPTTLFYWTLSDPPQKIKASTVETWVKSIPSSAKPVTGQATVKTGKSSTNRHSSTAPALMSASSCVTSSVLTSNITITSTQDYVKIKQVPDSIYTYNGGLLDHEATAGVERNAAHASPIKGKRWLNSKVSIFLS